VVNELKPRNWEKPRTWVKPLTYKPKIIPCRAREIEQTIRPHWKVRPGDKILFHSWTGKPYYSKWGWRAKVDVIEAHPILVSLAGFQHYQYELTPEASEKGFWMLVKTPWDSDQGNILAAKDGIDPPTGKALGELLCKMHGIKNEWAKFQVIRWKNWREIPPKRNRIGRVVADEETATRKNQQASRNHETERDVERTGSDHTSERVDG
jgi:hypothetical protein